MAASKATVKLFVARRTFSSIKSTSFYARPDTDKETEKAAKEMFDKMMYDIRTAATKHLCDAEMEHSKEIFANLTKQR